MLRARGLPSMKASLPWAASLVCLEKQLRLKLALEVGQMTDAAGEGKTPKVKAHGYR